MPFHWFSKNKWESVYTTTDVEQYARLKGRLSDNGIRTKTKFLNSGGGYGGGYGHSSIYDILVKAADLHRARQLIQSEHD